MKRKGRLPELLAPAGDFDCLRAAIAAGADAVYVGGRAFNARAYAKNFDDAELSAAVLLCHLHGVKLYVTLNTLLYDDELDEAVEFAVKLKEMGVDALIVADLGLVARLRRCVPELELHASTQMSVHNTAGAEMAYLMGCTRVVLARELSGKDIAEVTEACTPETEVFLHGALCVCHSGQCLFSSMIGGRSGNRGECAQPCRLPYGKDKYPLSLTDLSLAEHIRELIRAGVASLKIEGRMKSADYVYNVTSVYRRLLDECRAARREEKLLLERTFSRGGFTDGYFVSRIDGKMTGIRSEEDKRSSRDLETTIPQVSRAPLTARALLKKDISSELTLTLRHPTRGVISAKVRGQAPQIAINAPLDASGVISRLCKMGATPFSLADNDVELELDDGIMLPVSAINDLRRRAVTELEEQLRIPEGREEKAPLLGAFVRDDVSLEHLDERSLLLSEMYTRVKENGAKSSSVGRKTALFLNPAPLRALSFDDLEFFDTIFVPLSVYADYAELCKGVYVPPVVMQGEFSEVAAMLANAKASGAEFALVGNLGMLNAVIEAGLVPLGDFRLNVMNSESARLLCSLLPSAPLLSVELPPREFSVIGGRAFTYGRIPLMITERCFIKENFGCKMCNEAVLEDRKGARFPMMREYRHRNLVLNAAVTYLGDKPALLHSPAVKGEHFLFSVESPSEISRVICAYASSETFPLRYPMRRMGRRDVKS